MPSNSRKPTKVKQTHYFGSLVRRKEFCETNYDTCRKVQKFPVIRIFAETEENWTLCKTASNMSKTTEINLYNRRLVIQIRQMFDHFQASKKIKFLWHQFLHFSIFFLKFRRNFLIFLGRNFCWKYKILEFGFSSILLIFQNFWTFEFFLPDERVSKYFFDFSYINLLDFDKKFKFQALGMGWYDLLMHGMGCQKFGSLRKVFDIVVMPRRNQESVFVNLQWMKLHPINIEVKFKDFFLFGRQNVSTWKDTIWIVLWIITSLEYVTTQQHLFAFSAVFGEQFQVKLFCKNV